MSIVKRRLFAACGWASLAFVINCGSVKESQGAGATCESICDRQGAAACSQTPTDYVSSCKLICAAARMKFPQCASQFDALSACAGSKITYGCDVDGIISTTPVGGCAAEGADCLSCTGDLIYCAP